MRDPRKPARIQDTPWSLSLPDRAVNSDGTEGGRWGFKGWTDRGGSPLHAWLFFIGFVVFPLWWLAGFVVPIPKTRRLEGGDTEKGVVLDDPQVEHGVYLITHLQFLFRPLTSVACCLMVTDYTSWRKRCRIMAGVSLVTYIPFIVCVAKYA